MNDEAASDAGLSFIVHRSSFIVLSVAAALSRFVALARSPWDPDELLFMSALRHYDVAAHHPHPPGFPLFIAAGKLLTLLGVDPFHALQALNVTAGMLLVPAMFALCRALRMTEQTSLAAAALLAFAPNVWFYGGTALSDVPSMLLVVAAVALLLRGNTLAGAIMLGVAGGFRPQSLVIGAAPFLARVRRVREVLVTSVIVAAGYVAAIALTGWRAYAEALSKHQQYITAVDSFRSPSRLPLWELFDDFFIWPYRAPAINVAITVLVLISGVLALLRRRPHVLMALASFGPFCLFAWLFLDRHSVSRFSIGYAPLVALMAADGLAVIARRFQLLGAAAIVTMMILWTWPALTEVRTTISPPMQAMNAARGAPILYADAHMKPFAEYFVPAVREDPATTLASGALRVSEGAGARTFARPRARLWNLARRRYFEVSVSPANPIVFGAGWYPAESDGGEEWRWMGRRAVAQLPPLRGSGRLTIVFYAPIDALPAPPNVTLSLSGRVLDRIAVAHEEIERTYDVSAGAANVFVIETDRVVNPAAQHLSADGRELGLRVKALRLEALP
jgi:hypothetical protein